MEEDHINQTTEESQLLETCDVFSITIAVVTNGN